MSNARKGKDSILKPMQFDRRRLAAIAGGALTLASLSALLFIVYRDSEALVEYVQAADRRQLVAVTAWYIIDTSVYVFTWSYIMRLLGGRVGFWRVVTIFAIANMAKRLPGTIWYVGGRAALYSRDGVPARTVIIASAIEGTLIWLAGLIVAVPFLVMVLPHLIWVWLGAGVTLLLLVLNPITLRWLLDKAAKGGELRRVALYHVYIWLGLYVAGWVFGGGVLASVLALFVNVPTGWVAWIVGSWTVAGSASMLATLLPSNLGVSEVALTALLSQTVSAGLATLVAVSTRVLTTALDLLAGSVALLIQRISKA